MQKQTFKNSYTKLYLVPPDIYHTIIKSLPNKTDISNIQNLNETDTMPPQHPSSDKDESESHSNQNDVSTVENDILQAENDNLKSDKFDGDMIMKKLDEIEKRIFTKNSEVSNCEISKNRKIKQFHCEICQKSFTTKFSMKRHKEKFHSIVKDVGNPNNSINSPAATLFKRPQSEISFKRQRDEDFDTHIPVLKKLKLDRKSNKRKSEETIENQTNKRLRSSLDNWVSY